LLLHPEVPVSGRLNDQLMGEARIKRSNCILTQGRFHGMSVALVGFIRVHP
jgi:hypothetical protein